MPSLPLGGFQKTNPNQKLTILHNTAEMQELLYWAIVDMLVADLSMERLSCVILIQIPLPRSPSPSAAYLSLCLSPVSAQRDKLLPRSQSQNLSKSPSCKWAQDADCQRFAKFSCLNNFPADWHVWNMIYSAYMWSRKTEDATDMISAVKETRWME